MPDDKDKYFNEFVSKMRLNSETFSKQIEIYCK